MNIFHGSPLGYHQIKTEWMNGRKHWAADEGKPWEVDCSKLEANRAVEGLAEEDYIGKLKKDITYYVVNFPHEDIEVPRISLGEDSKDSEECQ